MTMYNLLPYGEIRTAYCISLYKTSVYSDRQYEREVLDLINSEGRNIMNLEGKTGNLFHVEVRHGIYLISSDSQGPTEDGKSLAPGNATANSYLVIGEERALLFDLAVNHLRPLRIRGKRRLLTMDFEAIVVIVKYFSLQIVRAPIQKTNRLWHNRSWFFAWLCIGDVLICEWRGFLADAM